MSTGKTVYYVCDREDYERFEFRGHGKLIEYLKDPIFHAKSLIQRDAMFAVFMRDARIFYIEPGVLDCNCGQCEPVAALVKRAKLDNIPCEAF